MPFPEVDPTAFPPIFASYCIDFRYDAISGEFLREIGYANSYFLATNAGAALPLGYKNSCKKIRCHCGCGDEKRKSSKKKKCCPGTDALEVLAQSFVTNLAIALTLQPITTVY